jgi:hypothetical protein
VVIAWDRGEYEVIDPHGSGAAEAVRRGKLDLEMRGFKLHSAYTLVRTRNLRAAAQPDAKEHWFADQKAR